MEHTGGISGRISLVHAILGDCDSCSILRMQTVPQYLAPGQRGGVSVYPDRIRVAHTGIYRRGDFYGSPYAGQLLSDGLCAELLHDDRDPVLLPPAAVLCIPSGDGASHGGTGPGDGHRSG